MSDNWSAIAGAEYYKVLDHYNDEANRGAWELTAGLNYNIDTTKYVGLYVTKDVMHVATGNWEILDGYGFGAKFGIDF